MSNSANIKPIGTRVLLQVVEEEQKIGTLQIPDTGKENESRKAKVVALGSGVNSKGKKIDFSVKEGDVVIYRKYSGDEIEQNGVKYVVIEQSDIVAIVS